MPQWSRHLESAATRNISSDFKESTVSTQLTKICCYRFERNCFNPHLLMRACVSRHKAQVPSSLNSRPTCQLAALFPTITER